MRDSVKEATDRPKQIGRLRKFVYRAFKKATYHHYQGSELSRVGRYQEAISY
jgi:hypothetical protein